MKALPCIAVVCLLCGCSSGSDPVQSDAGAGFPDAGTQAVVYSYVDDSGKIRMAATIQDVPAAFRDQVVVTDTASSRSERIGVERILVVDLRKEEDGRPLNYSVVNLDSLGRASEKSPEIRDPGDLGGYLVGELAYRINQALGLGRPAGAARVILYSAPWCGYCKKAARHLEARGVPFELKDIERDRSAAVELSRKLRQAGISGGGVPVLDIGGTMVVGFNQRKIDSLLEENK